MDNKKEMALQKADDNHISLSPIPKEFLDRMQKFQRGIDRPPAKVVTETIGGQSFHHLPISYVEHLLKKFYFGLYQIEVISYSMMVNEVTVHVRLRVFHPVLGQWMAYDGLSAMPVMMEQGSKVHEFIEKKKTKALNLNLPTAYSLAVKNAAKKIGKIFGGDLNRKHEDTYMPFNMDATPLNE